jgi:hypothetical protein
MAYISTKQVGNGTSDYKTDIVKKDLLKGRRKTATTKTVASARKKKPKKK